MYEIIKKGNKTFNSRQHYFLCTCSACGCVYRADTEDVEVVCTDVRKRDGIETATLTATSFCPLCHSKSEVDFHL